MVEATKKEIAGWWTDLTKAQRAFRAVGWALTFVFVLAAKLQGWTEVPSRISNVETAIVRQDSVIRRLERGEARAEYLFCVDLADRKLIRMTPQDCYQDYSIRERP